MSPVIACPPTLSEAFAVAITFFNGTVFALAPIALVIMLIYGGTMRMLGTGNPQNIAKANGYIQWSIIGFFLVFLSGLLVSIIIQISGIPGIDPVSSINSLFGGVQTRTCSP